MAYVALNPSFIERVQAKIGHMCGAEIKTLGAQPEIYVTEKSDFFLDNVWGEHKHLHALMPSGFKNNFNEWRITISINEAQFAISINTMHMKDCYPPNYTWYNHHATEKLDYPEVAPLLTYLRAKAEILDRWESVEEKVIGFLKECKSLNEAVKLWPDVVIYVDPDDVKRLEAKREKAETTSRAAEALAALNTDELMGAAVIARLSGADV